MSTARRLVGCLRPYWVQVLMLVLCVATVTSATLFIPAKVRDLFDFLQVDTGVRSGGSGSLAGPGDLDRVALVIILVYAAKGVFTYGQTYFTYFIGQRVAVDLRDRIFRHLQRLSMSYYQRKRSGEVVSRFTNDVSLVQNSVISGAADLVSQTAIAVGALVSVFMLNWRLSMLAMVMMPVVALVVSRLGERVRTITGLVQSKISDVTSILQETLSGIRVIKAFTMENHEIERFSRENETTFALGMKSAKIGATLGPIAEFLAVVGISSVLWVGGREVLAGHLTIGDLMAFILLIGIAGSPLGSLSRIYHNLNIGLAAAQRIFDILDLETEVPDAGGGKVLRSVTGEIDIEGVTFGYEGSETVLDDVSLHVKAGEMVALVGPNGAGKSTLVNLIPRFFDPQRGRILLDGVDIREIRLESLRSHIGLVPQDTILFGVTVRENIAYGSKGATFAEVVEAAKAAHAHEFIMKLPNGYDTLLGDQGCNLSGGQKQRIAIARAILRNPRILILDEATSALDPESERLVQSAIENLLKGRTTFVIAHRLSTIINADKIVVMDGGRVVECGRQDELLAANGLYSRLFAAQSRQYQVV